MIGRITSLIVTPAFVMLLALDVADDDYVALMAIYDSCGGAAWTFDSPDGAWGGPKESATVADWDGVSVANGRVSELDLRGFDLDGSLPDEIGLLTKVRRFDAIRTGVRGSIPAAIGGMKALRVLQLSDCNLSGPIPPEIADCANIKEIRLARNRLTGALPARLGELQKLTDLFLENNRLSGPLPAELAQCGMLKVLRLFDNQFSGAIPAAWGDFPALQHMMLHENQLTGAIPAELASCTTLRWLKLEDNRLSGTLPPALMQLSDMRFFTFARNAGIEGEIPASWVDWTDLEQISLVGTSLTVPPPGDLYDWVDARASTGWADGLLPPMTRTIGLQFVNAAGPMVGVTVTVTPGEGEQDSTETGVDFGGLDGRTSYLFDFKTPPSGDI